MHPVSVLVKIVIISGGGGHGYIRCCPKLTWPGRNFSISLLDKSVIGRVWRWFNSGIISWCIKGGSVEGLVVGSVGVSVGISLGGVVGGSIRGSIGGSVGVLQVHKVCWEGPTVDA